MDHKRLNKLVAALVFLISAVTYIKTLSDTVVFWDVGEFLASAYYLQVPHPPGAPLFLLIGKLFGMLPLYHDPAPRVHIISALASALSAMFLYLSIVKIVNIWRPRTGETWNSITLYTAAAIGALSLTFSPTFWFNAVEAEVYGASMFFLSVVTWLALRWNEKADSPIHQRYIFLIAYLIGLSLGVHLLALLVIFPFMIIIFFRKYEFSVRNYIIFGLVALAIFGVIYQGVVKEFPNMLDGEYSLGSGPETKSIIWTMIPIAAVLAALYGVFYSIRKKKEILNIVSLSFLLIVLGYSSYTMVIIRANAHTPMNENDPSTLKQLVSYLNREQYGDAPILQRRYSQEPQHQGIYTNYTSDWDFLWRYQLNHMFFRYLYWQYIGRVGDFQDAGVNWNQLYGIPLFIGLFGIYFHFKKDWKMAFVLLNMFILLGPILALYQNQQEPQPRERDYFYVGAFFVYSIWIGIGTIGLAEYVRRFFGKVNIKNAATGGVLAFALIFVPINMLRTNYDTCDRTGDYVAWDYSYNLLQSCEPEAILFTNGDNDTFPLWYLQDVEGVRRDIRIVNLSLVNTSWYIDQLKNEEPWGAKKVPISLSETEIQQIGPIQWEPRQMTLPVPANVMREYEQYRSDRPAQPALPSDTTAKAGEIKFTLNNTMTFGKIKAIRAQDIMAFDIIRTNHWQRPIYFAVTSTPDSKIGLDRYFRMDGLAMKLIPYETPNDDGIIDPKILSANLMNPVETPSKTFHRGYLYRGLRDSTVHYDENVLRLVMNYRNAFMRLSLYYLNTLHDNDKAAAVLDSMQERFPANVIPLDYRVESDIANFYHYANAQKQYDKISDDLEQRMLKIVSRPVTEQFTNQYHPYYILMDLYKNRGEYDKALDILDRISSTYGNVKGLSSWVESQRQQIMAQKGMASTAKKDTAKN